MAETWTEGGWPVKECSYLSVRTWEEEEYTVSYTGRPAPKLETVMWCDICEQDVTPEDIISGDGCPREGCIAIKVMRGGGINDRFFS